jgi:hypothetical protein
MLGAMRFGLFLASVCLTVAACHTWQVQPGPTASVLAAADSTRPVRLTLATGAEIEVMAPRIVGDTVVGYSRATGQRVAFAVADVRGVAQQKVSAGRTALAAGGLTAVALAVLVVVAAVALIAALATN